MMTIVMAELFRGIGYPRCPKGVILGPTESGALEDNRGIHIFLTFG